MNQEENFRWLGASAIWSMYSERFHLNRGPAFCQGFPCGAGKSVFIVSFPVKYHCQLHPLDPSEFRQPCSYKHLVEMRLNRTSSQFQLFGDFSLITPQQ